MGKARYLTRPVPSDGARFPFVELTRPGVREKGPRGWATAGSIADGILGSITFQSDAPSGAMRAFGDKLDDVLGYIDVGATNDTVVSFIKLKRGARNGQIALASGYHARGDGGGGVFWWSSASEAADDGGLTFLPAEGAGAGRWLRVPGPILSVKHFGARGSGDDTAALQAAMDSLKTTGGVLHFPEGRYNISAQLRCYRGTLLRGTMPYARNFFSTFDRGSMLVATGTAWTAGQAMVRFDYADDETPADDDAGFTGAERLGFRGLGQAPTTFVNGTATGGSANTAVLEAADQQADDFYNGWVLYIVSGTGAGQFRLVSDYVSSTNTVTLAPGWEIIVDATSVYRLFPAVHGALVFGLRDADFDRCLFVKNPGHGLYIQSDAGRAAFGNRSFISFCKAQQNGLKGIWHDGADSHLVSNECGQNGNQGLQVGTGMEVLGGKYWNNELDGLATTQGKNTFVGFLCHDNGRAGVSCAGGPNVFIGACYGNGHLGRGNGKQAGIQISGGAGNVVAGLIVDPTPDAGANGQLYGVFSSVDATVMGVTGAATTALVHFSAGNNDIRMSHLPTTNPGVGRLWNDAGTVKVGT